MSYLKNRNRTGFLKHLGLFLLVEILFVFIIFREIPPFGLLSLTGILHTTYWIILIIAGIWRERLHTVGKRFLTTYLPIVYHVAIHIYMGVRSVYEMNEHGHHDEHELVRIIIGTLVAGLMIAFGEYYLHRAHRLEEHHRLHHADEDCADEIL